MLMTVAPRRTARITAAASPATEPKPLPTVASGSSSAGRRGGEKAALDWRMEISVTPGQVRRSRRRIGSRGDETGHQSAVRVAVGQAVAGGHEVAAVDDPRQARMRCDTGVDDCDALTHAGAEPVDPVDVEKREPCARQRWVGPRGRDRALGPLFGAAGRCVLAGRHRCDQRQVDGCRRVQCR